jgi:hypothetical protein
MNATGVQKVAEIPSSIELFSHAVIQVPLHGYQLEPSSGCPRFAPPRAHPNRSPFAA